MTVLSPNVTNFITIALMVLATGVIVSFVRKQMGG